MDKGASSPKIAGSAVATPPSSPRRFIFDPSDMEHFRISSARRELLAFVSAAGRGLLLDDDDDGDVDEPSTDECYDPKSPLLSGHLTPSLASLHGSLTHMCEAWMDGSNGGIPPDTQVRARFGNPAFRTWHERLVERSEAIVVCLMDCHREFKDGRDGGGNGAGGLTGFSKEVLEKCALRGYFSAAASDDTAVADADSDPIRSKKETAIIAELRAYLHLSFGHPIRIDYGTGHESSFAVFLLTLCKIGCFDGAGVNSNDDDDKLKSRKRNKRIGAASVSLFQAYLAVTRGLQRDYMLEPAGSHGVWGLDDYHCIPFYLGACQLAGREQRRKRWLTRNRSSSSRLQSLSLSNDSQQQRPQPQQLEEQWGPETIHDKTLLASQGNTQLYFGCIRFVREIKPRVPFFESSPMLDDISKTLSDWNKVATGMLRLYEGEVLDRLPVVQHFVFGNIYKADWTPSRLNPRGLPVGVAGEMPMGVAPWARNPSQQGGGTGGLPAGMPMGVAPWAKNPSQQGGGGRPTDVYPGGMPPTRAPWAKK